MKTAKFLFICASFACLAIPAGAEVSAKIQLEGKLKWEVGILGRRESGWIWMHKDGENQGLGLQDYSIKYMEFIFDFEPGEVLKLYEEEEYDTVNLILMKGLEPTFRFLDLKNSATELQHLLLKSLYWSGEYAKCSEYCDLILRRSKDKRNKKIAALLKVLSLMGLEKPHLAKQYMDKISPLERYEPDAALYWFTNVLVKLYEKDWLASYQGVAEMISFSSKDLEWVPAGLYLSSMLYEKNDKVDVARQVRKELVMIAPETRWVGESARLPIFMEKWLAAVDEENENHGKFTGNPMLNETGAGGKTGHSVYFDGINDRMTFIGPDELLGKISGYSISVWVKPDFNNRRMPIIHDKSTMLLLDDRGVSLETINVENQSSFVSTRIQTGKWSHVVAVIDDASVLEFYVNGSPVGELIHPQVPLQAGTEWGVGFQSTNEFFQGYIDDIQIYDRPLKQTEVIGIYGDGQGGIADLPPVAFYTMGKASFFSEVNTARHKSIFFDRDIPVKEEVDDKNNLPIKKNDGEGNDLKKAEDEKISADNKKRKHYES